MGSAGLRNHGEGRLERLPGVGPALATRIRDAYGGEDAFGAACESFDLGRLLALPGLSQRRALEVAAGFRDGDGAPPLAATGHARRLAGRLAGFLAGYAATEYGRMRLRLLPTLREPGSIRKAQEAAVSWAASMADIDAAGATDALSDLHRLRPPARATVAGVVAVDDEAVERRLRRAGADRWVRIVSGRDALAAPREFDLVVYAFTDGRLGLDEAANVFSVDGQAPVHDIVPESVLATAVANRSCLEAMVRLGRLTGRPSAAENVVGALEGLASAQAALDMESAAAAALEVALARFLEQLPSVRVEGAEIMDLLAHGTPSALRQARSEAVAAGRAEFRHRTGLSADPFSAGLPLAVDEQEVERLRVDHSAREQLVAFEARQGAAAVVAATWGAVERELESWWVFDYEFAVSRFVQEFGCRPAESADRLRVVAGVNVELGASESVQRIDYEVGDDAPVAVLTGANSGGKSTLLDMLAQVVLLHHWGIPVPAAEAAVPVLDRLLVVGPTRGGDAGAFESFLADLFPPIVEPGRKLILLDEVESVTELDSAGRVLGVFVDRVVSSGSLCVLATHLPEQVLEHASVALRVDGIDAVGLDKDFNLVVDRQPKLGHRARSTPELILRRVHARSHGAVREAYAAVLARFVPSQG